MAARRAYNSTRRRKEKRRGLSRFGRCQPDDGQYDLATYRLSLVGEMDIPDRHAVKSQCPRQQGSGRYGLP